MLSVDILRGATVALMILVNDPGDPQCVYPQLAHAEWNGYTAADLVFPNFLFLSGVSLAFSLAGRIGRSTGDAGARLEIARGLGRRTVNLLLLKLLVAFAPTFRLRRIRLYGVLFRTALLSLAGGLILLMTLSVPVLLTLIAALLGGYWGALALPWNSTLNRPLLDPDNNLAAALDRRIAGYLQSRLHIGALWNITHDPEGLLSSAPALATVLMGCVVGLLLRQHTVTAPRKALLLMGAGAATLGAGHLWDRRFPINKNLWTSSYALAGGGWSLLALAALYAVYDLRPRQTGALRVMAKPLEIFGANALPVYILSVLGHKAARTVHLQHRGHSLSLRTLAYRKVFARRRSSPARSLAFAVSYAALCFIPNLILWRRKIFLKV